MFIIFPSLAKFFIENRIDNSLLNFSLYFVKLVLLVDLFDFTSIGIILFLFWITKSISFLSKVKHKNYKDNLTFFKIQETKTKRYLGLIRFSDMIPVPLKCITPLDFKNKSYGYKRLIHEQYSYINVSENRIKILKKAQKLYSIVTNSTNNKTSKFYKSLSCDFKVLEEKYFEYIKMH